MADDESLQVVKALFDYKPTDDGQILLEAGEVRFALAQKIGRAHV